MLPHFLLCGKSPIQIDTIFYSSTKTNQRNILAFGTFGLLLFGLSWFSRLRSKQKIRKQEIKNLKQKQKLLALDYMLQGQEDERKRITKELHDGLGSLIKRVHLQIQVVQDEIDKLSDINAFGKANELIDHAGTEVRRIAQNMMPAALVNLGLKEAVNDIVTQTNQSSSISTSAYFSFESDSISAVQSVNIYRIIQELVNNSVKYSNAENLFIQITASENQLLLTVEDDGKGFDKSADIKRDVIGLKNIESRVDYLNGKCEWNSSEKGTTFEADFDLKNE